MRVSFIAFTEAGLGLANRLAQGLDQQHIETQVDAGFGPDKVSHVAWTKARFADSDALVFVGATGIAVRSIAPCLVDKASDPAVVVMDERGAYAIPLVSGHIGGANKLAKLLSDYCGATPVVTTASDINKVFAVDSWAVEQGCQIPDTSGIKLITGALLAGREVACSSRFPIAGQPPAGVRMVRIPCETPLGEDLPLLEAAGVADLPLFHVGATLNHADLDIVAPVAILGVGCRKGTSAEAIEKAASSFLESSYVHPASLIQVASIDLKAQEPGLLAFAESRSLPFTTFSAEQLNELEGDFSSSEFVDGVTGTSCVCERAAVAAGGVLQIRKTVVDGITFALATKDPHLAWPDAAEAAMSAAPAEKPAAGAGSLTVVGLGPGDPRYMAQDAVRALQEATLVCGYHVYVDLAKQVAPQTPVFTTPMTKEIDRCRAALEQAVAGEQVAMVCSGDAGVYGMAGLCLELAEEYPDVAIQIVPGITAALSGASRLGAPLTHDFCVISLSDLLTPWELIEKRLKAAAEADFCVALYNPASRKRSDYLAKAADLLMTGKAPETMCGVVRNIGRPGEETWIGTLAELRDYPCDMFCTVFVGNAKTCKLGNRLVTPRGYESKPERAARPLGAQLEQAQPAHEAHEAREAGK